MRGRGGGCGVGDCGSRGDDCVAVLCSKDKDKPAFSRTRRLVCHREAQCSSIDRPKVTAQERPVAWLLCVHACAANPKLNF